ncbi:lipid A export permease/ATP-binding protein MsbA [Pseudoalteromonas denitrificans]|uniref:ATP-binding cassette, subfamily B, MsbA n=1 Tax=Pseudoalteromonas denitrificans DSM 6059 TaxID=1123010 RepID=A0A1I1NFE4_9GAMM|nr:lipid A export permease/ATP-binding protein MsbA [Pseudoalteromonas denitrificans]SFC96391.1 ATP-binding cassette, subfamily B, MsbA [Pseudoalteromonas denitrificans DSM 6059]
MGSTSSSHFKRLLAYIKKFKTVAIFSVVGMLGYSAMDALFIQLMQPFIDLGLSGDNDTIKSETLLYAPIIVMVLVFFRGFFNFISSYCLSYVGSQVVKTLRQELFEHMLHLPVTFHDKHSSGSLISKITFDTEQVQQAITKGMLILVREGAFVLFLLTGMFYISWQLSLIFLFIMPLVALIVSIVSKRFRKISTNIQTAMGDVTRCSEQMLKGHKVIHNFAGQKIEIESFAQVNNKNRQQRVKMDATKALSVSIIQLLAASSMAIILYLMAQPSMINSITAGSFTALLTSMMMMLRPLKQLANVNSDFQRGLSAAQSIFEILDLAIEKDTGTKKIDKAKGLIEIKNLTFNYPTKEAPVLNQLNLTIQPGENIALVGRSGSGKSTISNLLPRFYDVDLSNSILLDSMPLTDYKLKDLRAQFSVVSQQVVLFNDTIKNNICYGLQGDMPEQTLIEICKKAHVWEFVKDLPQGLDTMAGEDGVTLSGGQRQRIAIARALVKDAPILILDEATSALDTESEKLIQQALTELMQDKTSIVIAHRLSTIESSDQIYVIDAGKVIENGTHSELLSQDGAYAALSKIQSGDKK